MAERQRINESAGATNVVSGSEFTQILIDTLTIIFDTLSDHAGPSASDALVVHQNSNRLVEEHSHIFSKDGINIIDAIEFVSPIQTHIKGMMSFIGRRVDSKSHDGTTTAMMMASKLIIRCLEAISTGRISRTEAVVRLRSELALANDIVTRNTIYIDDLVNGRGISHREAKKFIAYHQAMISSKGDKELADAIVKVIETLPVEMYGQFNLSQSQTETDTRFNVVDDEFNFMFGASGDVSNYNYKLDTEYLAEECDMIVVEDDLLQGNSVHEFVMDIIAARTPAIAEKIFGKREYTPVEQTRDLVIVATTKIDSSVYEATAIHNQKHPKKIVIFSAISPAIYSGKCTYLQAIMACASVYPVMEHIIDPEKPFLIEGVKIHYRNNYLAISNLYVKDGSDYHPSYTNRDRFLPYTVMVDTIKETIEAYQSGTLRATSRSHELMLTEYIEIYRRMICSNVRRLEIAGRSHDALADQVVVRDSFGAVLSSIEHGFILDGITKLWLDMHEGAVLKQVAADVLDVINSDLAINRVSIPVTDTSYKYCYRLHNEDTLRSISVGGDDNIGNDTPVLIQPSAGMRELLIRIEELAPKIINTTRAVVPNTVNQKDSSHESSSK